jgi:hypothetical protein
MEFFFRVVTKIEASAKGVFNRSRLRGALVVALAGLSCVGCVGRKQYAINEAILISERRQLEDEIYRLQFELRDALEENERLRQELGGDADANKTAPRAKTNDAFFPGLDATQTRRSTNGGVQRIQTTSATDARPAIAPRRADSAPATGEAVETLPDYVPIPITSTRPGASSQGANGVRTAQNVGKPLGVRREVNGGVAPVAASTAPQGNAGNVVSSVFVDAPSSKEKPQGAAWSPLAQ